MRAASPYAIDVDPGNATVARGGSQPVTARLRGFESDKVELAVRSGPAGEWKRWPMTADGGADGFRFVLFGLDAAAEYYVEASGVRSASFRLDVSDIPYVKRVDLEYRFPAYTGLPAAGGRGHRRRRRPRRHRGRRPRHPDHEGRRRAASRSRATSRGR